MKRFVLFSFLFTTLYFQSYSQCAHDATVTPNNLIMCPDDTAYLSTQVFDDYQWYKDGVLIPGATNQTLMVTANNDAGSQFFCATTLALCTENSDTVLVDGWAFLLPFVITHTTPVDVGGSGEAYYCAGTTVELELGMPYDTNITWYESGTPIPGETGNFLYVTESGNYTCSGAPSLCPNFIMNLGVDIPIIILPPFEPDFNDYPEITWFMDECTNCDHCIFYLVGNSTPLDTGTMINWTDPWVSEGVPYLAECYDSMGCLGTDTLVIHTESIQENPFLQLSLYPNPALDVVQLLLQDDMENYRIRFIDVHGRIVYQQRMMSSIDVSSFAPGIYTVEVFSEKYFMRKRLIKQ